MMALTTMEREMLDATLAAYRKIGSGGQLKITRAREGWSVGIVHTEMFAQGGPNRVTYTENAALV